MKLSNQKSSYLTIEDNAFDRQGYAYKETKFDLIEFDHNLLSLVICSFCHKHSNLTINKMSIDCNSFKSIQYHEFYSLINRNEETIVPVIDINGPASETQRNCECWLSFYELKSLFHFNYQCYFNGVLYDFDDYLKQYCNINNAREN